MGNELEPLDERVRPFEKQMDNLKTSLEKIFSDPDFQAALDAMLSLAESIVSPGVFDGESVATSLKVIKVLAIIVIDLVRAAPDVLLEIFRLGAQMVGQIFAADVDNSAIQLIYGILTDGDTCSWAQRCALVVAIPHKSIYRLITGKPPYGKRTHDAHDGKPVLYLPLV
jgi:hypothetical protein